MPKIHDRLTARQVRAAVEAADDLDLVRSLVEPDDYNGWPPAMDYGGFYCPLCQARRTEWVLRGPAAHFCSGLTWVCGICGVHSTRWTLVRMVLESPEALARFLDYLPTAA